MNSRLQKLLADVKRRDGSFPASYNRFSRDVALFRAGTVPERSLSQLRAGTVAELAALVPVEITPEQRIAGDHMLRCPVIEFNSLREDAEERELQQLEPGLTLNELRERVRFLRTGASAVTPGEAHPANTADPAAVYMAVGWVENHSVRGYAELLKLGFGGLARKLETELARYPQASLERVKRENFLRAAMLVCDAGLTLGRRYAQAAAEQGMEQTARNCRNAVEHGANDFREAIQLLWFGHIIGCAEDGINANSLGRLDRILYPYYAGGGVTREEAKELLTELAVKLYLPYDVQAITLGGTDGEGKCAVNELSYLMLEATGEFGEIRDLSVRVTPDMPDSFLRQCSELVLRGGGIPFFFNDACFIPALNKRGIELADARNYAPIGCIELTVPGKTNPHAVSGWFNLLKVLELTLSGEKGRRKTLAGYSSFEEFSAAFSSLLEEFAADMIYHCRRREQSQREFGPLPALSLLTEDCIGRGRDITDGGAVYNYHSICLMGLPDTADALYAIRKTVFEDKTVNPETLLTALQNDFKGHELLRKQLAALPKYGNGIAEVDQTARKLALDFIGLMDRWSEPGNQLFVHLFTFKLNIDFGRNTGAMPDGRHAGAPLAYSLSAHQGRDLNGVTSLLHSIAAMPHPEAAGASAAIIDLHPSLFAGQDAPTLMTQLLKSAFAMGIGQLQWNIMSAEQLEKAKADPEHYGNIPVRVAGYSQLFKLIEPELQDHIIARYKHKAIS